ncbi:MAG: IS5 family transposase [Nitrospiraceae bacterium]
MKNLPLMHPHASVARRPMGTDVGAFSRGAHPGEPPGAQACAYARRVGGGVLDSEHRRAVASAAAVLSQLQNSLSPVPPWREREVLREIFTHLTNTLRDEGAIDERENFVDATFAAAKGGGDGIGPIRRGKGVKILAMVDRHGLPLSVSTHAANHHEVTLVHLSFDFYVLGAKPEHLIGDRAYDSDGLDDELKQDGVNLIVPHRSTRKLKTQDGRHLRRYQRRWFVERFFAWLQWKRRLLVRWEYYDTNFLGFTPLA